ncbi:family 1 glycosylhydrolase [Ferrimicrobium sp.]|uniref:glycoside hydrolase family 1 protein n=1 Tax=Ferrimicrobium sp. TaxID=2926050 RepID=UPI00263749D6|nr:family 1 glycosylhydrolase [Ferrimicrobium sp.]
MATDGVTVFPPSFVWGTATASYQIEGAVDEDGRGLSIWDTFSRTPGKVLHGDTGDIACDHYHRYAEDVQLMHELGINSYRFSIAWPRVQPEGKGELNPDGLRFYSELLDHLEANQIVPFPTLYHWDLPQSLGDQGGWSSRDTAYRFADYVDKLVSALGPRISQWTTLNEPWCSAWLGYAVGQHAPGETNVSAALAANHHLLLAHGLAAQAIRARSDAEVGITLNLAHVTPASDDPLDRLAATLTEGNANRMFLDPLFLGDYPADMMDLYGDARAEIKEGDLATISTVIDFLGVNYYAPAIVGSRERIAELQALGYCVDARRTPNLLDMTASAVHVKRPGFTSTQMGWEVEPATLTELLCNLRDQYRPIPIYITENGMSNADYVRQDGSVLDPERTAYLEGHLRAVAGAIAAGVDVRGYYVWSLLDNFEWALGYSQRFGIIWVDYATGERTPKASYYWYRDFIAAQARQPRECSVPPDPSSIPV